MDGNDPLAVYLACKEARKKAVQGSKPILVEVSRLLASHFDAYGPRERIPKSDLRLPPLVCFRQ